MDTIGDTTSSTQSDLTARIEALRTRNPGPATSAAPVTDDVALATAARIERLSTRKPPSAGVVPAKSRTRRRHPAKGSRMAALSLSMAVSGGLSYFFALGSAAQASAPVAPAVVVQSTAAPISSTEATAATPNSTGTSIKPVALTPTVVDGGVFANKFGPVQVQATFAADGSLSSVDILQFPDQDGKSIRINDSAIPTLNNEALASQSASVDTVSGATYTTKDYERSLQSAIDAARSAGLTNLI